MPSQPGNRCPTAEARKRRIEDQREAERLRRHRENIHKLSGHEKLTKRLPHLPSSLQTRPIKQELNAGSRALPEKESM